MSRQRRSAVQLGLLVLVALVASVTLGLNAFHASQYSKHLSNHNTQPYYYGTETAAASTIAASSTAASSIAASTTTYTPIYTDIYNENGTFVHTTVTQCHGAKCGYKRDTQAPDVPIATGPSPVIAARSTPAPVPPVGYGSNADGAPDLEDGLIHPFATKAKRQSPGNGEGSGSGGYYLDKRGRPWIIATAVWAAIIFLWAVANLVVNRDCPKVDTIALTLFIVAGIIILIPTGTTVIGQWPGRTPHKKTIYAIGYAFAWFLSGCLLFPLLVFQGFRARVKPGPSTPNNEAHPTTDVPDHDTPPPTQVATGSQ